MGNYRRHCYSGSFFYHMKSPNTPAKAQNPEELFCFASVWYTFLPRPYEYTFPILKTKYEILKVREREKLPSSIFCKIHSHWAIHLRTWWALWWLSKRENEKHGESEGGSRWRTKIRLMHFKWEDRKMQYYFCSLHSHKTTAHRGLQYAPLSQPNENSIYFNSAKSRQFKNSSN